MSFVIEKPWWNCHLEFAVLSDEIVDTLLPGEKGVVTLAETNEIIYKSLTFLKHNNIIKVLKRSLKLQQKPAHIFARTEVVPVYLLLGPRAKGHVGADPLPQSLKYICKSWIQKSFWRPLSICTLSRRKVWFKHINDEQSVTGILQLPPEPHGQETFDTSDPRKITEDRGDKIERREQGTRGTR